MMKIVSEDHSEQTQKLVSFGTKLKAASTQIRFRCISFSCLSLENTRACWMEKLFSQRRRMRDLSMDDMNESTKMRARKNCV